MARTGATLYGRAGSPSVQGVPAKMSTEQHEVDVVVVGAGFAGLYLLHRCRALGLEAVAIEVGDDVGGTWYWNRYPGARCDIESLEYSYSFDPDLQQEWEWTERYATQPEILRYLGHVADRFDLRRDIRFGTRVTGATYDGGRARWAVATDGDVAYDAQYVVLATGCLSSAMLPDIPGRDDFEGLSLHTGRWPHEPVDLTGMRVGVIGTGSSAIQSIPIIAEQADHLTVFQRTPTFAVPAHNRSLEPDEIAAIKVDYDAFREANRQANAAFGARVPLAGLTMGEMDDDERRKALDSAWEWGGLPYVGVFTDVLLDPASNEVAADYVRERIDEIVTDPEVAARLKPDQVVGCKRLCVDTGYYATYNRPNVSLVDLRETPIEAIDATGIRTTAEHHDLDCIVFATGFDAMTGSILKIDVRGRDGRPLADAWEAGPRTYLGLAVAGFPNLFTVTGPGSPSVLTNMVMSIEQHVELITDTMAHLRDEGLTTIEADEAAQDEWVDYVNAVAGLTLFPTCNSWYLGANVPGKTRVFMPLPGFPPYAERCAAVAAAGYEGFALSG
jgi:cation diffusion facilitator CzcD-associated flavoprotein CzcO